MCKQTETMDSDRTIIHVVYLLRLFLSVWIQLSQFFLALMHSNYVRQYSTVRFCAVSKDR